jgi:hypothetical protein
MIGDLLSLGERTEERGYRVFHILKKKKGRFLPPLPIPLPKGEGRYCATFLLDILSLHKFSPDMLVMI